MKLYTKRLILREIEKKDLKDLVRNINNLNVSKWLTSVPYPYTTKIAIEYIKKIRKIAKNKIPTDYSFFITLKSENKVIGCVGLHKIDRLNKTATLGYWLAEPYWNKGYMTEAVEHIMKFSFDKLKLRRIDVEAFIENKGSINIIRKLGFAYEGTRKAYHTSKADGRIHDVYIYGLLRENWLKRKN